MTCDIISILFTYLCTVHFLHCIIDSLTEVCLNTKFSKYQPLRLLGNSMLTHNDLSNLYIRTGLNCKHVYARMLAGWLVGVGWNGQIYCHSSQTSHGITSCQSLAVWGLSGRDD